MVTRIWKFENEHKNTTYKLKSPIIRTGEEIGVKGDYVECMPVPYVPRNDPRPLTLTL